MSNNTVEGKASKIRGQNLVPFLAHLEKIRAEHEAGWPVKAIYNRYASELDMSYIQFTRYVNRYIRKTQKPLPEAPVKSNASKPPIVPEENTLQASPQKESGFKQFVPGPKNPDPSELW